MTMTISEYFQSLDAGVELARKSAERWFSIIRDANCFSEGTVRLFDLVEKDSQLFFDEKLGMFSYQDLEIHLCSRGDYEALVHGLQLASVLELAAAPRLAGAIPFAQGGGAVASVFPGTATERAVSLYESGETLTPDALNRLVLDLELLLSAGWIHPYASVDTSHWSVHPRTKHVLLDRWEVLVPKDQGDEQEVLERIRMLSELAEKRAKDVKPVDLTTSPS